MTDIDEASRGEESENSISMLTTYRLKTTQRFKIVDTLRSMTFMENQYNMVLCRSHNSTEISLYDTSLPPDRNDGIEHFERLLAMDGHDSSVQSIS